MKPNNRIFLQGITKLEQKYQPKILSVIKSFRSKFISDLETNGIDYARSRLSLHHLNPELTTIVQAIYQDSGLFGARMTASELKAMVSQKDLNYLGIQYKRAGIRYKGFGTNQRWINAVSAFLKLHLLRLVGKITDTMRDDILNILERAFKKGLNINETVKELKSLPLMEARSRVIARTEVVRAANVGHSVGASETPYEVTKKWSAAKDHRTRHGHRDVNGLITDEQGAFKVPVYENETIAHYDNMQYPGDATASAANVCNCRCRAIYEPKRDSAGNLVMREQNTATVVPMNSVPQYTPAQIAAQLKANIQIIVE